MDLGSNFLFLYRRYHRYMAATHWLLRTTGAGAFCFRGEGPPWSIITPTRFSMFVLVEFVWDNTGKRTGSSNHEKNNNLNAGQVRSGPVSAPGAAVISRLQFITGAGQLEAGHRRVRARQTRPMRSRHPPCRRQQRSRRASLHQG